MNTYLLLKWLHILSAALMFGTGLGSAFFKWMTDRSGDVRAIAIVMERVVWQQIRMRDMAQKAAADSPALPNSYAHLCRYWMGLGAVAFSALVAVFFLMVFKHF